MSDRTPLLEAKLRGLVREHTGEEIELIESPGSAGGFVASRGFLLAEGGGSDARTGSLGIAERMLGPALLWAEQRGFESLSILSDPSIAGHLARRARHFEGGPPVTLLAIEGTTVSPAEPVDVLEVPELTPAEWSFAGVIAEGGARAVDDHGRIVGEFAGLEIARVILDTTSDRPAIPLLEVGVGQADRELHQLVHRDLDPDSGLRRALAAVAPHRHPGASPHPLNRLARERWLRSMILDDPSIVGLERAEALPPLRPRETLLGTQPVAAVGHKADGTVVVVVCSVGVEVDLAAEAADYRHRTDPTAELLIVIPPRDRYPVVERLVERLPRTTLVTLPPPWE